LLATTANTDEEWTSNVTEAHMSINRLQFSDDAELDLQFMRALAGAPYGGASPGEVLHVARTIQRRGGDRDTYIATWARHGARVAGQAQEALARGRRTTARHAFLRAYNYLRAAEFYFPADHLEERRKLYDQGLAQFDAATELMPHPAEKIEIPYEPGVTLPGYMFSPDRDPRPRPTVVVCGGLDGAGEEMYFLGGVPEALSRGLNVIVFHGPGQRGLQLHHPEQAFRPEAEVPVSAVLDYAVARPEVDGDRLALYGVSFGGHLAPRAAAHDPRVGALVANAPITDLLDLLVQTIGAVPDSRVADLLRSAPWPAAANVDNYLLWHHGVETLDEFAEHVAQFTLAGLVEEIACPTLCVAAEGESPGAAAQARQFFDALRAPKQFAALLAADGADTHCGISNVPFTSALIYDWIVETLGEPEVRPSADRQPIGEEARHAAFSVAATANPGRTEENPGKASANLAIAKAIFGPESDPGSGRADDYRVLLDHLADDVVFKATIPEHTPISGEFRGKQAVADYFARLDQVAVFHQERPQQYIADGDRVVVLGDDSFEIRANGTTAHSEYATIVDYRDGLITSILIIQDLTAIADAYRTTTVSNADPALRAKDLVDIEEVVDILQHAQQNEQVEEFVGLLRPDATWVTAHGRRLIGRNEIGQFTRTVLPGAMSTSTATYAVVHVNFVRPDVAVVSVRQRPVALDHRPLEDQPEGRPTYVMAKDAGHWKIAAGQNTQVQDG
jgi:uncharacterized protein (TIGR02246 family)